MLGINKFKYNTGEVLPIIINILGKYNYIGLTEQNDPINEIVREITNGITTHEILPKQYLNIYSFKVGIGQYYFCDRTANSGLDTVRQVLILNKKKLSEIGFELSNDDYFINNDCDTVERINNLYIRVRNKKAYEEIKDKILSILPVIEQFAAKGSSSSFFTFPEDNLIGYSISGKEISQVEIDTIISLMGRV